MILKSINLDRDCGEIHWVISAGVEPPILNIVLFRRAWGYGGYILPTRVLIGYRQHNSNELRLMGGCYFTSPSVIFQGTQRLDYTVHELIPLFSYYSNRKIIQMLYENNTEYTRKHSAACYKMYHEVLNVTRKTWSRFNMSIVYQLSVA